MAKLLERYKIKKQLSKSYNKFLQSNDLKEYTEGLDSVIDPILKAIEKEQPLDLDDLCN